MYCLFLSFSVLFVCICVLYDCHQVVTQLQLNMSYHIIPKLYLNTSLLQGAELILLSTFGAFKLINPATVLTSSQVPSSALDVMI